MVILIFFLGTNSLISWRRAHVFACSACRWCRGGCRWCCSHSGSDSCGREPARKTAVDWLASGCFASFPFPWLWSMIVVHERRNNDLHHPYHVSVKFHIFKSTGTSLWGTLFPLHESWRKSNWHQLTIISYALRPMSGHKIASTNNWIPLLLLLPLGNWVLGWGFKLYKTGATKFAHQISWLLKRAVMPNMWLLCTQKACCTQRQFTQ